MDIQMPEMNGYETIKSMREWENKIGIKTTPIIALSAHVFTKDIQKSIETGFNAHISKPIDINQLIKTISHFQL